VNGSSFAEGRVEIYFERSWATICSDEWDDDDASVICRQLGLSYTGQAAEFGHGSGKILLSNVTCVNNGSNIFECSHNGFENHNCTHDKDAGVKCHYATHHYNGKLFYNKIEFYTPKEYLLIKFSINSLHAYILSLYI